MLALTSALLFGVSTPASKILLRHLAPLQLAGLLYLGAAVGVLPVVAMETRRASGRARRGGGGRLTLAILFGGVLAPVLLLSGLRIAAASSVALVLNLEMAATAALGVIFFRDHLHRLGWFGVTGITLAAALLSGHGGNPGLLSGALVAGACLCWGLDNQLTALIDGITPARSTLWKGIVAGLVNLGLGALLSPLHAPPAAIAGAIGLGAVSYGISILLYIGSAQELGATRAQALFATAPFMGAAVSVLALHEPIGIIEIAAAVVLAASVTVLFRSGHGHEHVHGQQEHVHRHRHDDAHHLHEHAEPPRDGAHTHWHTHQPLAHAHPHWPDLHHRHDH